MITIFMSICNSIMVSPPAYHTLPVEKVVWHTESIFLAQEVDMLRYVIKNGGLYPCAKCFILSVGGLRATAINI